MSEQDADIKFNKAIHVVNEHGDPVRTDTGKIRLKPNWKDLVVDRQGRKYNAKVHGEKQELDADGYLKVRRRDAKPGIGSINRSAAFVKKHARPGYANYLMNEERMAEFLENDWEPVVTKEGQASMDGGRARDAHTKLVLMEKPIEWWEADQRKKREVRTVDLKQKLAPNEEQGQYRAGTTSPLR